jgi:hypothetical protein
MIWPAGGRRYGLSRLTRCRNKLTLPQMQRERLSHDLRWWWTGTRWVRTTPLSLSWLAMAPISLGVGCVGSILILVALVFGFVGAVSIGNAAGGDIGAGGLLLLSVSLAAMLGLVLVMGAGLSALNYRWWLVGPLLTGWPLYIWLAALSWTAVFDSRSDIAGLPWIYLSTVMFLGLMIGAGYATSRLLRRRAGVWRQMAGLAPLR